MTELALFDGAQTPTLPRPVEKLSADQRRTRRQHADVARGVHPLTRARVHEDEARTCGNCRFREVFGRGSRGYPKCTYGGGSMPRATHSAASDVRAWWPACRDHQPADRAV